jgi:hypothetical protein
MAVEPIINGLVFFYNLTGSLGVAIILLTACINFVPLLLESPYLYKQHRLDRPPILMGCLRGVVVNAIRIGSLIVLIQVFWSLPSSAPDLTRRLNEFLWSPLQLAPDESVSTRFVYLDLGDRDVWRPRGYSVPLPGPLVFVYALAGLAYFRWAKNIQNKHKQAIAPILSADLKRRPSSHATWRRIGPYLAPTVTIIIWVTIGVIVPSALLLYLISTLLVSLVRLSLFQTVFDD